MSGSLTGTRLLQAILNGELTGAELVSLLSSDPLTYKGPWREFIKTGGASKVFSVNPDALSVALADEWAAGVLLSRYADLIAASTPLTNALTANGPALVIALTTKAYLDLWQNTPANKTRLQNRINVSGSCLIRHVYDTAGTHTWTHPTGGILALSVSGGGGGGAGGGTSADGDGGSGAQFKANQFTSGLPSTDVTVTVGVGTVAGTKDSSFGAVITFTGGTNGDQSVGAPAGPGSNSGTFYDTALKTAIWHPGETEKKGGDGGSAVSGIASGNPGAAGLTGSGGAGGGGTNGSIGGSAGTGYGSGGGSGAFGGGTTPAPGAGTSAVSTDHGSGGGGGSDNAGGSPPGAGGDGAPGLVVAHAVTAIAQ